MGPRIEIGTKMCAAHSARWREVAVSPMLGPDALSARYYRQVVGTWSGEYRFVITDGLLMKAAVPSKLDRVRLRFLHLLGSTRMETSVTWTSKEEVRHTTRINSWGFTALNSVEIFRLHADGQRLSVRMIQRLAPTVWYAREFPEGHGEIQNPPVVAVYQLPWIGGEIYQQAKIVEQGVELSQTSPWFLGRVLLRRIRV